MRKTYAIFADYHQFYLRDAGKGSHALVDYTEEECYRRVAAAPFVVAIQPDRNLTVPVEVELLDHRPDDDFVAWDHVAEASLDLPSGRLEIQECMGDLIDLWLVAPGQYRVRAYFGGLDTIDTLGIDGDDHYRVVLWPAPMAPAALLKDFGRR